MKDAVYLHQFFTVFFFSNDITQYLLNVMSYSYTSMSDRYSLTDAIASILSTATVSQGLMLTIFSVSNHLLKQNSISDEEWNLLEELMVALHTGSVKIQS